MGTYRKLPVEIEAFRYKIDSIPNWFMDKVTTNDIIMREHICIIKTLEGNMIGTIGDYIIKGIKDEAYPCKPDIFEKSYEKVEEKKEELNYESTEII